MRDEPSQPPVTGREAAGLGMLLVVVFASRLPFLMHGLDEWDSANFALGVLHFDVLAHQPHPPGQWVYIRLMQLLNFFTCDELLTLSLGSALGSTLMLVPYYFAVRSVFRPAVALGAAALTAFSFGFWITSVRPISDPVAGLFVYATVCALLLGLKDRRWFVAGMALCGVALGVKQTALYFLAPFTIAVNVVVLWRGGWRRPMLGSLFFVLAIAIWLLPTVANAHGWASFFEASRTMQRRNYVSESVIFHLTTESVAAQARQNFLYPWGSDFVAVVMLVLAAGGFAICLRRGWRGLLFALFGATTVLYAFFFLYRYNKYFAYTVPIYCAFASAGIVFIGDWILAKTRWFVLILITPSAFAGLVILGVGAANPLIRDISHFEAPPQAAVHYLRALSGDGTRPLLLTDDSVAERHLLYFDFKGQIELLNRGNGLHDAVAALDAGRQVYLLSSMGLEVAAGARNARLVREFEWPSALYDPLQGRLELRHLMLYELCAPLPVDYRFDARTHPPLLFTGMWEDGWCSPEARIVVPSSGKEGDRAYLQFTVPAELGRRFPVELTCRFNGASETRLTLEHAGTADFSIPIPGTAGVHATELRISSPPLENPSPDGRPLAIHLDELGMVSADRPLHIQPESGWYARETDGKTRWRWTDGAATLAVHVQRPMKLAVTCSVLSASAGNALEMQIDGAAAGSVEVGDEAVPAAFHLALEPGIHRVTFHSRNAALATAGGGNPRALRVGDLQINPE